MKSLKYLLGKATFSSGSGMPIAFLLNLLILPLFTEVIQKNPLFAALLIGIIYTTVSIFRLFIIDVVEDRYGLNIRPAHLIQRLFKF